MFTPEQLITAWPGTLCPFCGDHSIVGGAFDCDDRAAWQRITCSNCGKSWQDIFHRDAIADMESEDYEEQPLPTLQRMAVLNLIKAWPTNNLAQAVNELREAFDLPA